MKVVPVLFIPTIATLLLASMFGAIAQEVHTNGFGGITPLNTTGLTVFSDSLKRSFEYESDSLVLSAEFSILETNGDIKDFSLFDNDLTIQNATPSSAPEFTSSTFRTGLETSPTKAQFIYDESMAVPIYWTAQISPTAVYYNNRTYFTWQGEDLDPFIIYYNHTTDIWSDPVEVGDNPLNPGSSDYHGAPTLLIDANGFLHVFFGAHETVLKHAKSDSAEDISAWTLQSDATGAWATYPHLVKTGDDNIFLVYRKTVTPGSYLTLALRESDDNASSWGAENTIVDFGTGYFIYPSFHWELEGTDQLHFAFRVYETAISRSPRSYHAIFNASDDKIYNITGVDLGTTVSKTEADNNLLISDVNDIQHGALHLDSSGNPYIIQETRNISGEGLNHSFIWWNGSSWENETIAVSGDNQSTTVAGTADFIVYSSTNIEAYLVTNSTSEGGDIERWSWNGTDWAQEQILLTEADSGEVLNNPSVPVNYNSELRVFFAQMDRDDFTNNDLEFYAHNGTDFIYGETLIGGQWASAPHSESLDMENTNVSMIWWGQIKETGITQYITGKGCSTSSFYNYGLALDAESEISAIIATNSCSFARIKTDLPSGGLSVNQTYGIGVVYELLQDGTDIHFWLDGEWIYNTSSTRKVGDNEKSYYVGRSQDTLPENFCNCTHDEVLVFKERLDNATMKLLTTKQHDVVIKSGPSTTTPGFAGLFFALPWLIVFGLLGWVFFVIFMAWREPFIRE